MNADQFNKAMSRQVSELQNESERLAHAANGVEDLRLDLRDLEDRSEKFDSRVDHGSEYDPVRLWLNARVPLDSFVTDTLPYKYKWDEYHIEFPDGTSGYVRVTGRMLIDRPVYQETPGDDQ